MLNKDYRELLQSLSDREVKFIVVGAYALGVHGFVRATGDINIWVEPGEDNSARVYNALEDFGSPLSDIDKNTFSEEGVIFQIGVVPRRIDIITRISGVDFKSAYSNRIEVNIDGLDIPFLSKDDLITNKRVAGRPKDKIDVDWLTEVKDLD